MFVDHLVERGGLVTPETSTPACPVLVPPAVSFFGRSRRGFLDRVLPLCNLQANGVHVVALDEARTGSVVNFQQQTYLWHGSIPFQRVPNIVAVPMEGSRCLWCQTGAIPKMKHES